MDYRKDGQVLSYLEHLSTEELEKLLCQDLALDDDLEQDSEYIMAIMEVISRRDTDKTTHTVDVDAAWRDFQENYQGQADVYEAVYLCDQPSDSQQGGETGKKARVPKPARVLFRVAVAAAVLAALLAVPAFGQESLFQIAARWTQEQFGFQFTETQPDERTLDGQLAPIPEEYVEFIAALRKTGVEQITVPRYIPEGFCVAGHSLNVAPGTGAVEFSILYQKDDLTLIFQASEHPGEIVRYEKDNSNVDIYSCGGIDHYLFTDNTTNAAAWYVDGVEYSVGTDLMVIDIKDIIESMY